MTSPAQNQKQKKNFFERKSETKILIYDILAQNHKHKHKFQIYDFHFSLSEIINTNTNTNSHDWGELNPEKEKKRKKKKKWRMRWSEAMSRLWPWARKMRGRGLCRLCDSARSATARTKRSWESREPVRRRRGLKPVRRRREEDERGRGLSLLVAVCVVGLWLCVWES